MNWVFAEMKETSFLSPAHQPYPMFLSPPPPPEPSGFSLNNKVSPSILLIIIILAIIFFVSGLLHLLVRFLLRPTNRDPYEMDNDVTALQGQLQQLFHLHDSGVDQSFIDTLPVFSYKAIVGVKDPFDCAVCLCEFECEDKLRLLPKCSHAFHMDCIDTWLLSHSTCPLCRASLLGECTGNSNFAPLVLVLESGSCSSREVTRVNSHLSEECDERGQEKEDENAKRIVGCREKVVLSVKLGKFRNIDNNGGEGSNNNNDGEENDANARRCFSMGSFAYVMDENTSFQVPIITKKQSTKKQPLTPGHRLAMSECGCDSTREFKFSGFEAFSKIQRDSISSSHRNDNKGIFGTSNKRESFSVSKIWLRGKKDKGSGGAEMESSRRAFSFRVPAGGDEAKGKNERRTISEIDTSSMGFDEEIERCNSLDAQVNHTPSFARRTLLWIMGKQNKVVHHHHDQSSFSSNV